MPEFSWLCDKVESCCHSDIGKQWWLHRWADEDSLYLPEHVSFFAMKQLSWHSQKQSNTCLAVAKWGDTTWNMTSSCRYRCSQLQNHCGTAGCGLNRRLHAQLGIQMCICNSGKSSATLHLESISTSKICWKNMMQKRGAHSRHITSKKNNVSHGSWCDRPVTIACILCSSKLN